MPTLYRLENRSALSRAIAIVPSFLSRVSRSGRTTHWSYDTKKAMTKTRDEWRAFRERHPRLQVESRLVRVRSAQ